MQDTDEIVYGKNNVLNYIKTKKVNKIYVLKTLKNKEFLKQVDKNTAIVQVDKLFLDRLTNKGVHQGIAISMSAIEYLDLNEILKKIEIEKNPLIMMLDEVHDPNNLGAIIRTIDCFNLDGIIINKRRSAQISSAVAKVSTGAVNFVDIIRVTNLINAIKKLKAKGFWIACLDMNGENEIQSFNFNLPLVVILGGENKGITDNIKKQCDFSIKIPITGHVNSLNVANAAAILSYQKMQSGN